MQWEIYIRLNGPWKILYRGSQQNMKTAFRRLVELGHLTKLVSHGRAIATNDRALAVEEGCEYFCQSLERSK